MNEQVTVGLIQMAMGEDREANVENAFAMARRRASAAPS